MTREFRPNCLPTLIGSLPMDDHDKAQKLVLDHTGEVPLWVQLPSHPQEGMMAQFLPGMPGYMPDTDKTSLDTGPGQFDEELLAFYEDYMAVTEGQADLNTSRFALTEETAKGFFVLLDQLNSLATPPLAVKGQITGPITFGTGISDSDGRPIFYNTQLRDAATKLLAMKARWQVRRLSPFGVPVLVFFDEPAMAGFGSSTFISISSEDIRACFQEVITAVHEEGALAGIHVCANTDWSLILESDADVISFDAYTYFDRFILYPDLIRTFFASGKLLAWGIVPSLNAEDIEKETAASLTANWIEKANQVVNLGIDRETVIAQSLITPACGTGSLSLPLARKVLSLTRSVSDLIRDGHKF